MSPLQFLTWLAKKLFFTGLGLSTLIFLAMAYIEDNAGYLLFLTIPFTLVAACAWVVLHTLSSLIVKNNTSPLGWGLILGWVIIHALVYLINIRDLWDVLFPMLFFNIVYLVVSVVLLSVFHNPMYTISDTARTLPKKLNMKLVLIVGLIVIVPLLLRPYVAFILSKMYSERQYSVPEITETSPAQQAEVLPKIENPTTSYEMAQSPIEPCDLEMLYGFPYYRVPNTNISCYKTSILANAAADTLTPLGRVPPEIVDVIVMDAQDNTIYDLAFDKNYFYVNGSSVYSAFDETFEMITSHRINQSGYIKVNGVVYEVGATGLMGATLKKQ